MFSFKSRQKQPIYGALFDIGSSTVGVAIAEFDFNKPIPHIIFSRRFKMRVTKQNARKDILMRKVRESIFSAALVLSQNGIKTLIEYKKNAKITKLYVTCSSPWSYNLARTVEYRKDDTFKITESIIEDLVRSAEEAIFVYLKQKDRNADKDYSVVERTTVDVSVNDYSVENPIDLHGSSVSLSHIIGLIPNKIILSIQESQDKLFPETKLQMHTYMLIMYCIIRDIFPHLSKLCIIDVTGGSIEFGIVENGILIENEFLNYGSSTLIHEVVKVTKKPISDVITMLSDYGNAQIDSSALTPIIDKQIAEYAKGIEEIMKQRVMPNDIVLTAHRVFEPLFKYMVESAFKIATGKKCVVLTLDPKFVNDITTESSGDVYLALEARFFHKLHGCSEIKGN